MKGGEEWLRALYSDVLETQRVGKGVGSRRVKDIISWVASIVTHGAIAQLATADSSTLGVSGRWGESQVRISACAIAYILLIFSKFAL